MHPSTLHLAIGGGEAAVRRRPGNCTRILSPCGRRASLLEARQRALCHAAPATLPGSTLALSKRCLTGRRLQWQRSQRRPSGQQQERSNSPKRWACCCCCLCWHAADHANRDGPHCWPLADCDCDATETLPVSWDLAGPTPHAGGWRAVCLAAPPVEGHRLHQGVRTYRGDVVCACVLQRRCLQQAGTQPTRMH